MKVTLVDLVTQYHNMKDEMDEAIHAVIDSGHFVLGEANQQFESNLSEYIAVEQDNSRLIVTHNCDG